MGEGTGDKAEGKWDRVKGKVKEGVGDATDNPEMEDEGEKEQAKGKAKEAWGDTKNAADKVKESIKDAFD